MIDLNHCNEWQHRDETGMVLPWYTKSFLDELVTWELRDKVVFEYGAGASTVWYMDKGATVISFDSNKDYVDEIYKAIARNSYKGMIYVLSNKENVIVQAGTRGTFDIAIIDCDPIQWRDACVQPALDCLKPGGKLIIDNWMQSSVDWMPSEETQRLLSQYPAKVYHQEGHPDWKTAVFTKVK